MTFRRPLGSRQRRGPIDSQQAPEDAAATRDFDAEIARTIEDADTLRGQMAEALTAWLDVTAPWVAEFWELSLSRSVQQEADAVIALDQDARTAVKEDAQALIGNARDHIQRRLVDERHEDWPHLKPQTDPHDPVFRPEGARGPFDVDATRGEGSPPEVVAGRLNGVLGDIASLSANYGFLLSGFEHGDPFGHRGRWHAARENRPRWSTEMIATLAAYGVLHTRYVAVLAEREGIVHEQQRHLASQLWESA